MNNRLNFVRRGGRNDSGVNDDGVPYPDDLQMANGGMNVAQDGSYQLLPQQQYDPQQLQQYNQQQQQLQYNQQQQYQQQLQLQQQFDQQQQQLHSINAMNEINNNDNNNLQHNPQNFQNNLNNNPQNNLQNIQSHNLQNIQNHNPQSNAQDVNNVQNEVQNAPRNDANQTPGPRRGRGRPPNPNNNTNNPTQLNNNNASNHNSASSTANNPKNNNPHNANNSNHNNLNHHVTETIDDAYEPNSDDSSSEEESESEYEEGSRYKKKKKSAKKASKKQAHVNLGSRTSSRIAAASAQVSQQPQQSYTAPQRTSSRLQRHGQSQGRYVDDDDDEEESHNDENDEYYGTTSSRPQRNTSSPAKASYAADDTTHRRSTRARQSTATYYDDNSLDHNDGVDNDHRGTGYHQTKALSQHNGNGYADENNENNNNNQLTQNVHYSQYNSNITKASFIASSQSSSSSSASVSSFGDNSSLESDDYDEYLEILRSKNNKGGQEIDSDDEQFIFKRINPAEFAAFPTLPPSTVNMLAEAVHGVLAASNKEQTLHELASKLADLDSDPFLSHPTKTSSNGAPITSQGQEGSDGKNKEAKDAGSARDLQNQTILEGWGHVGGHKDHLKVLHEMIILPLLYPEIFQTFNISPPRGVLFTGPPGTGKTLTARTLATIVQNISGKKVSFFVRKGADCLSKWVGEAERQLRLLFDQAKAMQPAIIFFDEIDGLVPVRNSNQDHIHSSIVSTLLALMDGLDGRGEQVIVIGATNRVDSIDPALRRPGRFDRELTFSLPTQDERLDILKIHTKSWLEQRDGEDKVTNDEGISPERNNNNGAVTTAETLSRNNNMNNNSSAVTTVETLMPILSNVSHLTAGYSGADLQSLCTQASLCCLRRSLPQLYDASQAAGGVGGQNNCKDNNNFATQLGTNPTKMGQLLRSITVTQEDFVTAMKSITPTQQRVFSKSSQPLNATLKLIYDNNNEENDNVNNTTLIYNPNTNNKDNNSSSSSSKPSSKTQKIDYCPAYDGCNCCNLCKGIKNTNVYSKPPSSTTTTSISSKPPTLYSQLKSIMRTLLPLQSTGASANNDNNIHNTNNSMKIPFTTLYQNKLFLINRSNLGQHSLSQSLLIEYEEIPIYTLSLSSLHTLQSNYGTSSLYDTILTLFSHIKRDHFQGGYNTKYPTCIIHWPNIHQWYEYSYLRELIELVLLSLSECSHLVSNSLPVTQSTPSPSSNGETGGSGRTHGYLLLCDAEWDYFQIPSEILTIFNHTSAQGVVIDVSHSIFNNLLDYPHSVFPRDQYRVGGASVATSPGTSTKTATKSTQQQKKIQDQLDLFSLFDPAVSIGADGLGQEEQVLTSNCHCMCSNKVANRLSTILSSVLNTFVKQYMLQYAAEATQLGDSIGGDYDDHDAAADDDDDNNDLGQGKPQVKRKKVGKNIDVTDILDNNNTEDNTDLNGLVQLPSLQPPQQEEIPQQPQLQPPQQEEIAQQPKTLSQFLSTSYLPEELTTPDKIYFSMREQRYREIILLHLRMFLRNVNSHLLSHFKDFVLTRDDFPPLPTNTGMLSDDYGLTLTDILTKINLGEYLSIREYLSDIDLLVTQTKIRFNLSTDIGSIMIQRVCSLQDVALTLCLGFDIQISTACELIAKELRLKQQLIYTQLMKLHYLYPKINPPIVLHNVKLFGHVFQHDSLLMVTDLRKHVQLYISQQQTRRFLKLQQDKLNNLNPTIITPSISSPFVPSNIQQESTVTTTAMNDDNGPVNGLKKRPLEDTTTPEKQSPSSSPQCPQFSQFNLALLLEQTYLLIQQLEIFSPTIDIPTLESFHQQLLQCLFTPIVGSNSPLDIFPTASMSSSADQLYDNVQVRIIAVLNRFLSFCRKNDEIHFDSFFTPQWINLCTQQQQQQQRQQSQ